jgi:hypothetical protein
MRLTGREKKIIENAIVTVIENNPAGIDTRKLIEMVMEAIAALIPHANRHHVSGMLSWVWRHYKYHFLIRTRGYSVISSQNM